MKKSFLCVLRASAVKSAPPESAQHVAVNGLRNSGFGFRLSRRNHMQAGTSFGFRPYPRHSSFVIRHSSFGFTLIELLVVIAIMAILAALIFPVTAAVNKNK